MIEIISEAPANVAAFRATGEVTSEDFDLVVFPEVERKIALYKDLNYLMDIETPLKHWTAGAWLKDAFLGLKEFARWGRVAILTDTETINRFTDLVSPLVPGEYKGFETGKLTEALAWVSGKSSVE